MNWFQRPKPNWLMRCFASAWLLTASTICSAQPAPVGSTAGVAANPAAASEASAPGKPAAAGGDSPWDRLVYVPFRSLQQTLAGEGAVAIVPLRLLNDWWGRLQTLEAKHLTEPAAVGAGLAEARYVITLDGDLARIEADLAVRVLTDDRLRLPLRFGTAALGELSCDDKRVWLRAVGDGEYEVRFPEPGAYRVRFEMAARVRNTPSGREIQLEIPRSVTTSVQLTVPGEEQAFDLEPLAAAVETVVSEGVSRLTARLPATGSLIARWRPRTVAEPVLDPLATVKNVTQVRLGDGLIQSESRLDYQILRGSLGRVEVRAPLGTRIIEVTAPGLKSWSVAPDDSGQTISVELLEGESKRLPVRVLTESSLPTETFAVAGMTEAGQVQGVHAGGGWRENGILTVSSTADLAVVIEKQQGLIRVEPVEVPPELARADALAWRYFNTGFELRMTARPVAPRIQSQRHSQVLFREAGWELTEEFQLQIDRASVFELRFGLPAELVVDSVEGDAVKSHQVVGDPPELLVTLRDGVQGEVRLKVTGRRRLTGPEESSRTLTLLTPRLAVRDRGEVWAAAAENLELVFDDRSVERLQPATAPPAAPPAGARWLAGWVFPALPEFTWSMNRRSPRWGATVATSVRVRRDLAEIETQVAGTVQYAPLDTFRLAIPENLADSLRVLPGSPQTPPIRQQAREEGGPAGWVFWKIVLQRPVLGPFQLNLRADQKLGLPPGARQLRFAVAPIRVRTGGLDGTDTLANPTSVEGQVVVQRDRTLSVGAEADEGLESIDLRELTLLSGEGDLAFRYGAQPDEFGQPQSLQLTSTQLEIQPVLETLVSKAALEAVVTEDSKVTCRMRYELRTSERQRLDLVLPKDSIPLDTVVAGKRVELERSPVESPDKRWDAYQIPVIRNRTADEPFVIALIYQTPYNPRPLPGRGGNLQIFVPRLGKGAGDEGVVIQQLRTAVWVPQEFGLVRVPQGFTAVHPARFSWLQGAVGHATDTADLDRWFGTGGEGLYAFQTAGRAYEYARLGEIPALTVSYWKTDFFTWWISGALLAAGIVLTKTSWSNRVSILLLCTFGLALLSMQSWDLVIHLLGAARFGLGCALAWWIVQGLRGLRTSRDSDGAGVNVAPVVSGADSSMG